MLKSRPISHNLADKTVKLVINDAKYYDIQRLKKSSWEERTIVLRNGGYSRYREQTATNLGVLADVIIEEYGEFYRR